MLYIGSEREGTSNWGNGKTTDLCNYYGAVRDDATCFYTGEKSGTFNPLRNINGNKHELQLSVKIPDEKAGTNVCVAVASYNYHIPVYIIKLDIAGYFMHIKRSILYDRVIWGLNRQFAGNYGRRYKMLKYVIGEVILDDPVRGVKIQGSYEDWRGLPEDKSLFAQPPGQGLVIGNLTSQFFSNVYLDALDRFIEFDLGYKYYGRYVDDFYVVVKECELSQAKKDIREISTFLNGIGLSLNVKKTRIIPSPQGVPFLGMVVRNGAVIPGKRITNNFVDAANEFVLGAGKIEAIISYLGLMSNYNCAKVMRKVFDQVGWEYRY